VSEDLSDPPSNGARLRHFRPCGKDRRARFHPLFSRSARRCRSSVVEHPLGKGEVVSSILTGSTSRSRSPARRALSGAHCATPIAVS
jgi:hypothetical protein